MARTRILFTAIALIALAAVGAASAAAPKRPLNVVSLGDPTIGGHLFLGRTPLQVTSAFGKPSARTATRQARRSATATGRSASRSASPTAS